MLIGLREVLKPKTTGEALKLLREPESYPLYGSGAALLRAQHQQIETAVDLTGIVGVKIEPKHDTYVIGAGATLEALADADAQLGAFIRADLPATLRNAFTVGDALMESAPNSLLLAALYGLGARLDTPERGDNNMELARWFTLDPLERRQTVILNVVIPFYPQTTWRMAYEKVARTPQDGPIVAAVGFAYVGTSNPGSYSVVVGVDHKPVRYQVGLNSVIADYKGSAAYRTEMAAIVHQRAIAKAEALTK